MHANGTRPIPIHRSKQRTVCWRNPRIQWFSYLATGKQNMQTQARSNHTTSMVKQVTRWKNLVRQAISWNFFYQKLGITSNIHKTAKKLVKMRAFLVCFLSTAEVFWIIKFKLGQPTAGYKSFKLFYQLN